MKLLTPILLFHRVYVVRTGYRTMAGRNTLRETVLLDLLELAPSLLQILGRIWIVDEVKVHIFDAELRTAVGIRREYGVEILETCTSLRLFLIASGIVVRPDHLVVR